MLPTLRSQLIQGTLSAATLGTAAFTGAQALVHTFKPDIKYAQVGDIKMA